MFQYRAVLVRLRQGDSDRDIARARLMGRPKAAALRALAAREGWLARDTPLPEDAAIAALIKRAGVGARVPWHQDGEYWPIRPPATVTVWIALDRVDRGNGAMQWVPGSHRVGYFKHRNVANPQFALDNEIDDPRFDPRAARYNELEPGELSLHDVLLVHGSEPNTSSRRQPVSRSR